MPIQRLPPEVSRQIAAGEVVERPASVAKELVENSLDAGARRVTVEMQRGGAERLRVVDDGCGIPEGELELAFARHATSKLSTIEDLARVATLGFRGEALAAIAAAAEVRCSSRPAEQLAAAWIRIAGGELLGRGREGKPHGTDIGMTRLFHAQPARRKFLRSAGAEAAAVAGVVTRLALSRPDVRFTLTSDGRLLLRTDGSGELRDVCRALYGSAADHLLPVEFEAPGVRVTGLVSPPGTWRGSRGAMTVFVNGRWVSSRAPLFAIERAYQDGLPTGQHPLAVLDVRLAPEEVDVNVHPAKTDVRFRDERVVLSALTAAAHSAISRSAPVPAAGALLSGGAQTFEGDDAAPLRLVSPPWAPRLPLEEPAVPQLPADARSPGEAAAPPASAGPPPARSANGAGDAPVAGPALPPLRIVGQVGATYIVAEGPEGMFLIDQHAAHERVLYERFCARPEGEDLQPLLVPQVCQLSPGASAALVADRRVLETVGVQADPLDGGAWLVRAVPAPLVKRDLSQLLSELGALAAEEPDLPRRRDRSLMTAACHASVRAGMSLSLDEMREIVLALESCRQPRTCPHGRPTVVHVPATALEREFRRR